MYQLSDGIRCTHSQECTTILDTHRGQMFNLNTVGSRALELLQSGLEVSDIVAKIKLEFGVSPDIADRDVQEFIAALKGHKVIKEISSMSERSRR